jgi:hypothetical protein
MKRRQFVGGLAGLGASIAVGDARKLLAGVREGADTGGITTTTGEETFFMGLYVPTVAHDDATPVAAENVGEVRRAPGEAAIMQPDATHWHDADFFGWSDPWWVGEEVSGDYSLRIPATVVWNSTVSAEEFGTVAFKPDGDTVGLAPRAPRDADYDGVFIENQPIGRRTIYLTPAYDAVDDVPANNYFREAGLTLTVEFRGESRLRELAPKGSMSATVQYVTPNKSVLGVNGVLEDAASTYSQGLSVAEEITRLRQASLLRKVGRLGAYAQAQRSGWADEITESELVTKATLTGLSAFTDEVEAVAASSQFYDEDVSLVPSGPAVAFRAGSTDSDGDGVPDARDPYPEDPDGDDDGLDDGEDPAPTDPDADDDGYEDGEDPAPRDPDIPRQGGDDGLARFDLDGSHYIEADEVLNAISAFNRGGTVGGEPVTRQDVLALIAAYNGDEYVA